MVAGLAAAERLGVGRGRRGGAGWRRQLGEGEAVSLCAGDGGRGDDRLVVLGDDGSEKRGGAAASDRVDVDGDVAGVGGSEELGVVAAQRTGRVIEAQFDGASGEGGDVAAVDVEHGPPRR